jgi:mono/diheme cytochrome c family protein
MKSAKLRVYMVAVVSVFAVCANSSAVAAGKRCRVQGKKVECPVQSAEALQKAAQAYEKEADDMAMGKSGSTYGIQPFDYLTGVGKRTEKTTLNEGESGYAGSTGRTELWDRVKNAKPGEAIYNQWVNQWSAKLDSSLVPGADPNEGKTWYYMYCITCHGWTLQGNGPSAYMLDPSPRILTKGDYMNKKTNLELFRVIKGGGEAVSLSSSMPAWGNFLQDQDIWNVIAWIRAMADVGPPKTLEEYLNPKSTFKPIAGDVTPLNVGTSEDFADEQELLETELAGRGGDIQGGGFVEGGLRKAPEDVNVAND